MKRASASYVCCEQLLSTIAVFPVTDLVILNEFCLCLFVLTIIIKRFKKSLMQQSNGRLNDSLIYIFLFMGYCKRGGSQRGLMKHTQHTVHSYGHSCHSAASSSAQWMESLEVWEGNCIHSPVVGLTRPDPGHSSLRPARGQYTALPLRVLGSWIVDLCPI